MFTQKEVAIGDSPELFQWVEDPEREKVVLGRLDVIITELRLVGLTNRNQPH